MQCLIIPFMDSLIIETLAVGLFQSNVFILGDKETGDAVVIDPGDDIQDVLDILHKEDMFLYEQLPTQASFFGITADEIVKIDKCLEDGMEIGEGSLKCRVIHTPGHTPGSVSFYFQPGIVFTGDTLFRWSIGRTDLWGSSHEELMTSIKDKLFKLDDRTTVYPGHGPSTTIGSEKRDNPFLKTLIL